MASAIIATITSPSSPSVINAAIQTDNEELDELQQALQTAGEEADELLQALQQAGQGSGHAGIGSTPSVLR